MCGVCIHVHVETNALDSVNCVDGSCCHTTAFFSIAALYAPVSISGFNSCISRVAETMTQVCVFHYTCLHVHVDTSNCVVCESHLEIHSVTDHFTIVTAGRGSTYTCNTCTCTLYSAYTITHKAVFMVL